MCGAHFDLSGVRGTYVAGDHDWWVLNQGLNLSGDHEPFCEALLP
jgi:hypothetical protein